MWFDSHCHLHLCAERDSLEEVVQRARAAGVLDLLTVGIDVASSRRSVEIASEFGVRAAVGVHPNSSSEWDSGAREQIAELAADPCCVAIGESGLDFFRDRASPDEQRAAFSDHIRLAKDNDKTLVIHTRDSVDQALDQLGEEEPPPRLIFHCWSGTEKQMVRALDLGANISFAGNVSFKNAQALREVALHVPDDRLLVETDSPFLAPEPHRGKTNEPRHVAFVGVALAQARNVPVPQIAEQTFVNARTAFALA